MSEEQKPQRYTSFLGIGWGFPPQFPREAGGVRMVADAEDVADSLRILFGTILGERFFQPAYGLEMHGLLFEPLSTTMKTLITDRIRAAILIYEPRISLISLELDTSTQTEGRVSIVLEYALRTTNSRYNLVYPFFRSDSSEVRRSIETKSAMK